jgi:DNA-directed RNA polymerase subunit RPC12/RpoP
MGQKKRLRSDDGNCPYCRSDFVIKSGGIGVKPCEIDEEPGCKVFLYKCYKCNKEFYCLAE